MDDLEEGIRIGGRNLNNLRYADDVTLSANKKTDLQSLLEKVITASEKAGLYLNVKKTKVTANTKIDSFCVNHENIEVVNSFVLLGSIIEEDGDCRLEIGGDWHWEEWQWQDCRRSGKTETYRNLQNPDWYKL